MHRRHCPRDANSRLCAKQRLSVFGDSEELAAAPRNRWPAGSRASEWLCMCVYTCVHVFKHVWLSEWKTKIILEKFDEEMKEREERRGSIRANQAASAVFSWANVRARPGFLAGIGKSSSLGNRKSYPLKFWSRIQHNSFLSWQLFSTKSDHGKLTSWP